MTDGDDGEARGEASPADEPEEEIIEGELLQEVDPRAALALTTDNVGPAVSRRRRVKAQRMKNGSFRIQLRDPLNPNGKRIEIRDWDESTCIARAVRVSQMRRDVKAGIATTPEHIAHMRAIAEGPYTVERAWREYLAKREPGTQYNLRNAWANHFEKTLGTVTLAQLSADMMTKWEIDCARKHRASTIRTHFALLAAALRQHIPHRLPMLPWGKWDPSGIGCAPEREKGSLGSIDEVNAMLLVARARDLKNRAWGYFACIEAMLTVAVFCGLRQSELAALGWDDVMLAELPSGDEKEGMSLLQVRHAVKRHWKRRHPDWPRPLDPPKARKNKRTSAVGKGDKPQRLHAQVVRILRAQRRYLEDWQVFRPDGPIFPVMYPNGENGAWRADEECIDNETFRDDILARAFPDWPESKLDSFSVHSLRHTFSTLESVAIIQHGGNLKDIAERTRHRDLTVLQGYIHKTGAGLVPSHVPDVSPELRDAAIAGRLSSGASRGPSPPPLQLMTSEACTEVERALLLERELKKAKGQGCDYEAAYQKWVAAGRIGKRPKEVTEHFSAIYSKAYVKSVRASECADEGARKKEAQAYAKRVMWATRGSWAKFLKSREGSPSVKTAKRSRPELPAEERSNAHGTTHEAEAKAIAGETQDHDRLAPGHLRRGGRVRGA